MSEAERRYKGRYIESDYLTDENGTTYIYNTPNRAQRRAERSDLRHGRQR